MPFWAQNYSNQWSGHFSYLDINEIIEVNNKVYAASENAIFSFNIDTNEIKEITTINGLSGENISTIYYSEMYELLVIGYENGLVEIVFDNEDDILTVVDIFNKPTIPGNLKRINHFNAHENVVYISADYGISVFDLERLEFGDTYFIGNNGSQIPVNQTTVYNNFIYAACPNNGILRADLSESNIVDFQNWETINSGSFNFLSNYGSKLYTIDSNRRLYEILNGSLTLVSTFNSSPIDLKTTDENLVVTTADELYIFDADLNLRNTVQISNVFDAKASSAIKNLDDLYIGSNGKGMLKVDINDPTFSEEIHPKGPLLNRPFSLNFTNGNLRVLHGGYGIDYSWAGGRRISGISRFNTEEWINIEYDSISAKIDTPFFLSHLSVNPFDNNQVYVSSYYSGLIEMNGDEPVALSNRDNSTLVPFTGDFYLTSTSAYDSEGALWVLNGRVQSPLNKFENDSWQSFDFTDLIAIPNSNNGFSNIVFNDDNDIFFGSFGYGLIGFRANNGRPIVKNISAIEENMPSNKVLTVALDNRGQLWMGTLKGLRVLFDPKSIFEDGNIRAEEIIIEEDGIAKELLFEQLIRKIIVDGSNNKWIGTIGSGLFYLSSDGQKTIFHFTKDNSPLPSENIIDLALDGNTGTLYIATEKGLVSYQTGSASTEQDFTKSHAYPNPVRPAFDIVEEKVKISDLPENVNIKITDIEGNLVAEAESGTNLRYNGFNLEIDGGIAYWNGKNLANNIVASGVYLILLSDLESFETKVIKLMVVR
ncbi:two-component regulator propeller domain-containing protein [Flavobacteriaceae bacterium MHTCC 0001]